MSELDRAIAQDARELRRGVLVTYLGYALKLGMPLLLALATRTYGAERWGVFLAAQASVLVALRVGLLGLDKAALWAVATCPPHDARRIVQPLLYRVGLGSCAAAAALWLLAQTWPALAESERAALRIAALALPPYALSELLLHAAMGRRRMELQVLVRETLNPLTQVLAALALFHVGVRELGLSWAFVLAQLLGLVVAAIGFARLFRDARWGGVANLDMPAGVARYAAPLWLADSANSLLLRLDTLVLAALTDPVTVGIWGIVGQFANALRQIRRAYDPIVTALAARIAVRRDAERLSATFSYAVQMVTLTQLPVFVCLLLSADLIMPLYGAGFARGAVPLMVLASFFLLSGGAALAGLVVTGYGRSGLTLFNVLLGAMLQLGLLAWLVPRHGLLGAALAVGASLCVVNVVQLLQLRWVTGSFHYTERARFSLVVTAVCCTLTLLALLTSRSVSLGAWQTRGVALLAFALSYGALLALGARRGLLRAPGRVAEGQPGGEADAIST
jgi:O-antigen/teichoic acid export membrane protein